MPEQKKLSAEQLRGVLLRDSAAVEMVLVDLDEDVVRSLRQRFGTGWKKEAAAILKKGSEDL
jgi:hypothetical protein